MPSDLSFNGLSWLYSCVFSLFSSSSTSPPPPSPPSPSSSSSSPPPPPPSPSSSSSYPSSHLVISPCIFPHFTTLIFFISYVVISFYFHIKGEHFLQVNLELINNVNVFEKENNIGYKNRNQ